MKILLIILAILYTLSPIDVLPDALIGLGWMDDIVRGERLYKRYSY